MSASPNSPRTPRQPDAGLRPNLREVAEAAGVALSSASRVLSGHPDVSRQMRARVLAAAESLGYEHNLLWDGLRLGTTHTIGIVVRDVTSSLWSDIALGAEALLRAHGYSMLLSNSGGSPDLDLAQIRLLDQRRVDGILVSPADPDNEAVLALLSRLRIPVVAIDRELPPGLRASQVLIDHRTGVGAAGEELLALGHRRLGLVSPPAALRPAAESTAVLRELCEAQDATLEVIAGPFTVEQGLFAASKLLEGPRPVTAIICGSNQLFPGVMIKIRELGLLVPRDVSVIAIEDAALLPVLTPPIGFVSRQPRLVGQTAAQLMLDRLHGAGPVTEVIETAYTPGESCAPPPSVKRQPVN